MLIFETTLIRAFEDIQLFCAKKASVKSTSIKSTCYGIGLAALSLVSMALTSNSAIFKTASVGLAGSSFVASFGIINLLNIAIESRIN